MSIKKNTKIENKNLVIILLFLVILFLIFLLIENISMFGNYRNISHKSDIKKSIKKNDTKEYKTVGWIDVYDTGLNMPIFSLTDGFNGSVKVEKFSWTYSSLKNNNFITIFGHNIMNLGIPSKSNSKNFNRFEELMTYVYPEFADKHRYFQLTINNKDSVYKIFSVALIKAYDVDTFPMNGATRKQMTQYINLFKDESIYKYNTKVNNSDNIVILSTCTRLLNYTYNYYDIVVVGKKINNKLLDNNGKLEKTNKYKTIEESLKR